MFIPTFEGPIEGWTVNFLKKNFWRIKKLMDQEDAMQEARYVFLILQQRMWKNGNIIENERHFMSLYKTAFSRHLDTLSNKNSHTIDIDHNQEDWGQALDLSRKSEHNEGQLAVLIDRAPQEIKDLLKILLSAPSEVLELGESSMNRFLCKLLGIDPKKTNLANQVKAYFIE